MNHLVDIFGEPSLSILLVLVNVLMLLTMNACLFQFFISIGEVLVHQHSAVLIQR